MPQVCGLMRARRFHKAIWRHAFVRFRTRARPNRMIELTKHFLCLMVCDCFLHRDVLSAGPPGSVPEVGSLVVPIFTSPSIQRFTARRARVGMRSRASRERTSKILCGPSLSGSDQGLWPKAIMEFRVCALVHGKGKPEPVQTITSYWI